MKNLKKAELAIIGLTLLCLCFTAGYFIGRDAGTHVISFDKLPVLSASPAVSPVTAEQAKDSGAAAAAAVSGAAVSPSLSSSAPATASAVSGKININTASLSMLDSLPGIGPVLAQNIIDYREKNGSFKSTQQLNDVAGIGDKKFEAIKDLITAG